jgi:spore coat polysaccharide biosynthesis protein SpsF
MLNTLGIVEAALTTELKGKVARKLGGKSLLEWIVRRVSESARLAGVVVVSCDVESDSLAELTPPDVAFYASEGRDALATYCHVLRRHLAGGAVRICADTPFIDPVLIDRLVRTADDHRQCDYISYSLRGGQPAIFSPLGIFAEWCRADCLYDAECHATEPLDRRLPTRFIYSHPERYRVRLIQTPAGLDRDDLRLTIASEEDWEHTQAIYEALGPEGLDWQRVAELLDHHPGLRERMAVLNKEVSGE